MDLMISYIHDLSNVMINNQLDTQVMKIFESKNKNVTSIQNTSLT